MRIVQRHHRRHFGSAALLALLASSGCASPVPPTLELHIEEFMNVADTVQLDVTVSSSADDRTALPIDHVRFPDGTSAGPLGFPEVVRTKAPALDQPFQLLVIALDGDGTAVGCASSTGIVGVGTNVVPLTIEKRMTCQPTDGGPPDASSADIAPRDSEILPDSTPTDLPGVGLGTDGGARSATDASIGDRPVALGEDAPPLLRDLGTSCVSPAECASGFCADSVCCQMACDGACSVCNLDGLRGTCVPAPAGQDPRDRCPHDEAPCGRDGLCDGAGQCRRTPLGTSCTKARCADGMLTPAGTCDSAGACVSPGPQLCPNGCSSNTTACAPPAGKLDNGKACVTASQCASSTCVDGVCCATTCPTCFACDLPGSPGTCAPVPDGEDPHDDCAADAGQPCGRDGLCNGAGACRLRARGTPCAPASCSGATKTSAITCDGQGNCNIAGVTSACLPYTCNAAGTDCDDTCANNPGACPVGQVCSNRCGNPSTCCTP